MTQNITINSTYFAARKYRAAAGFSGIEQGVAPPPKQFKFNDIRAIGATSARHVTVQQKGCNVPCSVLIHKPK